MTGVYVMNSWCLCEVIKGSFYDFNNIMFLRSVVFQFANELGALLHDSLESYDITILENS